MISRGRYFFHFKRLSIPYVHWPCSCSQQLWVMQASYLTPGGARKVNLHQPHLWSWERGNVGGWGEWFHPILRALRHPKTKHGVDVDEIAYLGPHSSGGWNVFHIDGIHMRLQLKHVKLLLKHQVAQKHPKTTSFGPGKQIIGTRSTH